MHGIADHFPPYRAYDPAVPVYCLTPGSRHSIHRFFDTPPISPSRRYLAVTEFPFDDHIPQPGDEASVVVIDLQTGNEVYRSMTAAWDTQLGAQVQWGANDNALYFNRMAREHWVPYGVRVDISTGAEKRLEHTVYMVSPGGDQILSPCLRRIAHVQPGYGVIVPDLSELKNHGAPQDDGIYITDTETGKSRLLLSIADIVAAQPQTFTDLDLSGGGFYGFHVKWNPQGSRIMFVIRWIGDDGRRGSYLITCDARGDNICTPIDAQTWHGGHHPNWCPDGEHIIMNLVERKPKPSFNREKRFLEKATRKISQKLKSDLRYFSDEEAMRFAIFLYDGSGLRYVCRPHFGSGHPTLSPDSTHILTDAYPRERVAYMDGTVPLRWINLETAQMHELVRIDTLPRVNGPRAALRIDPHPAWVHDGSAIVFNGSRNGARQVYIAIMKDAPL